MRTALKGGSTPLTMLGDPCAETPIVVIQNNPY
jgi:hypothetical protein